jgi:hypothetical protein
MQFFNDSFYPQITQIFDAKTSPWCSWRLGGSTKRNNRQKHQAIGENNRSDYKTRIKCARIIFLGEV